MTDSSLRLQCSNERKERMMEILNNESPFVTFSQTPLQVIAIATTLALPLLILCLIVRHTKYLPFLRNIFPFSWISSTSSLASPSSHSSSSGEKSTWLNIWLASLFNSCTCEQFCNAMMERLQFELQASATVAKLSTPMVILKPFHTNIGFPRGVVEKPHQ